MLSQIWPRDAPYIISYPTLILFTLTATILCADLILNEFKLRIFFYFCKSDVSAVQSHPRSLYHEFEFMMVGLHITNFGLNSKTAFHTRVASIYSCSVTADVIGKEARKIAAFMSFFWPHPYSTPILGVFPLHQTAHVGVSESGDPKLFGRAIIFEVFQPVWKSYLNVTDGRTDDMQSHSRALRSIAR